MNPDPTIMQVNKQQTTPLMIVIPKPNANIVRGKRARKTSI